MPRFFRDLDNLPKRKDYHIVADYIELLCLVNIDRTTSQAEILDRYREGADLRGVTQEVQDEIERELLEAEIGNHAQGRIGPAEIDDKWAIKAAEWFQYLRYRHDEFPDAYPFELSVDNKVLTLKDNLSSLQKLYIFFLLSSNLGKLAIGHNLLTSCFELLSYEALKVALPLEAEIHLFGSNNPFHERRYKGGFRAKLQALADDLRERVMAHEDDINKHNNGDGGLDIVAWVPFNDNVGGLFLLFGQCACTEDWVIKQHSSHKSTWGRLLSFTAPPSNIAFIPFCYRKPDGRWFDETKIHESILIDRQRLLYLLGNKSDEILQTLHRCSEVIDTALREREGLV